MTRRRNGYVTYAEEKAIVERVTGKLKPGAPYVSAIDVFDIVQRAVSTHTRENGKFYPDFDPPRPDVQDCLDALRFAEKVREHVDWNELRIIDYARANGATWQQLAEALGYRDRQAAERRYRSLRARWPGYKPLPPAVGPSESTASDQEGA